MTKCKLVYFCPFYIMSNHADADCKIDTLSWQFIKCLKLTMPFIESTLGILKKDSFCKMHVVIL